MTIEKALQVLITELTKGRNYKKVLKDFEKWVIEKDRTNYPINYFLIFDIDTMVYGKRSEYNITHNQIALVVAKVPAKRDKDKIPIIYKKMEYKEKKPE